MIIIHDLYLPEASTFGIHEERNESLIFPRLLRGLLVDDDPGLYIDSNATFGSHSHQLPQGILGHV